MIWIFEEAENRKLEIGLKNISPVLWFLLSVLSFGTTCK
jgi:hypothetical protein